MSALQINHLNLFVQSIDCVQRSNVRLDDQTFEEDQT